MVLGGLAGVVGGIFAGLKWGEALRDKPQAAYWMANAAMMIGGIAVVFAGNLAGLVGVTIAGIGVMGGGVTGLKYGLGKTVGVWRTVDKVTGSDELPEG